MIGFCLPADAFGFQFSSVIFGSVLSSLWFSSRISIHGVLCGWEERIEAIEAVRNSVEGGKKNENITVTGTNKWWINAVSLFHVYSSKNSYGLCAIFM